MSKFEEFLQQRYQPNSKDISLGADTSIEHLSDRLFNALNRPEEIITPPVVGLYG